MLQPEMLSSFSSSNTQVAGEHHRQQHHNTGGATGLTVRNSIKRHPSNLIANVGLSYEDVLNDDFQFDMDGHDVMVFLHIQKTGGTSFGRHLVRDLDLKVSPVVQLK